MKVISALFVRFLHLSGQFHPSPPIRKLKRNKNRKAFMTLQHFKLYMAVVGTPAFDYFLLALAPAGLLQLFFFSFIQGLNRQLRLVVILSF